MTDDLSEFVEACLEPFPEEAIGHLPRAGMTLQYVGHAHITERLLQLDPEWNWEPVAFDENGLPRILIVGDEAILWIRLTIQGITRLGVGTVKANAFDMPKQLIGDALRNAGMRFGLALSLWAKSDLVSEMTSREQVAAQHVANTQPPADPDYIEMIRELVETLNDDDKAKIADYMKDRRIPSLKTGGTPQHQADMVMAEVQKLLAAQDQGEDRYDEPTLPGQEPF